jgi:hypothetical protein
MERLRRELEAEEAEYEQHLADARKKEATLKKMAKARVTKKPVCAFLSSHRDLPIVGAETNSQPNGTVRPRGRYFPTRGRHTC